jgi:photosystem II stability/assembly factor-like uncharacterized protein
MSRRLAIVALVLFAVGAAAVQAARPSFTPLSFTAVGERDYWVLGADSVLHTTDGGAHFTRLPAPPLSGERGVTRMLRFADGADGYAFVPRGSFAVTHDGGRTWRVLHLGSPIAFATGGGLVHVVFARCSPSGCSSYRLATSPVGVDAWRLSPLPFRAADAIVSLAAHGDDVWLLGTVGDLERARAELAHSSDGGATWHLGASPCFAGLGADFEPVSASVVWAVCPTGMMAGAARSTDGGTTFARVHTPPLVNSAELAPASPTVAVVAGNGAGFRFRRTVDGGRSWEPVRVPAVPTAVEWVGFTDARVGAAVVATRGGTQLWRTTDGGAAWSRVRL